MRRKVVLAALLLGTSGLMAGCDQVKNAVGGKQAEVKETEFPEKVLWGDTHLHTANSVDAFGFGVRLGPEDALRFARGEEVTATTGMKAKLSRPLDFLVVTDHAEALGGKAPAGLPRIAHVHVVGAGLMGGDIAAWCALRGFTVSLQDRGAGIGRVDRLGGDLVRRHRQVGRHRGGVDRPGDGAGDDDLAHAAHPRLHSAAKATSAWAKAVPNTPCTTPVTVSSMVCSISLPKPPAMRSSAARSAAIKVSPSR